MAERPSLHVAVAGQKNKASEYNDNFEMMMDYVEEACTEATDYVDDQVDSKANLTLSNVTSLSDAVKTLLGNDYAKKDLSNVTGGSITGKMTTTDKNNIIGFTAPDWTRAYSVAWQSSKYTIPADGYFSFAMGGSDGSNNYCYIQSSGSSTKRPILQFAASAYDSDRVLRTCIRVNKNDVITGNVYTTQTAYFIPMKGA